MRRLTPAGKFWIGYLLLLVVIAFWLVGCAPEHRDIELASLDCYNAGQRACLIRGAIECR